MPDGFDQFVAARLDRLLRYATAMTCDRYLAQDIVQEVLLRAQRRWDRIGTMDAPYLYVQRMVTNEYLSWWRRRASRDIASPATTIAAHTPPVGDPAERHAERDAMRARIAQLPRKQRAALVLRYYEDRTDDEIASVLNCSAGTVRSHISRALKTLRTNDRIMEVL
ncbi:SigE family RNA polymerase sigma factor [Kibdelosporangium phytohabitans]|uniref:RNA polymerase subunit sigma-24 n=1 Tax=Kibdelosporangium phytohabitans TaxID=860235 RepID=A0A0N9I9G3_9PSEU|nr:SigE family RNA polymerase sigma factor [Kibdelosporangium phytohabitans]ALG11357.1 RNA polymerase subunit sigma-24 [Kibdelosporangium phytohabitans]MBE1462677.1 RNA polymerase sigma-70 factor (sigma-E family) [Kibdelosporangium phytohabitans]